MDIHNYASEVFGDCKSPLLEAHPDSYLQDLDQLSIQRDDVKAVVTIYAYQFESKVLIPSKGSGGKKMAELIPPTLAVSAMQSVYGQSRRGRWCG